jgi:hypothetical protein
VHVVTQAGGYPHFLQQLGQETWNEAAGPTITLADARVVVTKGWAALDNGFFRTRWDRATFAEQRHLRAMAEDGGTGSRSGDVAGRLGHKITSLVPTRAKLIAKGLIDAPEHGLVAYTVPGMADFVRRQPEPQRSRPRGPAGGRGGPAGSPDEGHAPQAHPEEAKSSGRRHQGDRTWTPGWA